MANGLTANGPKTTIGFWDGLSAKSRQGGFFFCGRNENRKKDPSHLVVFENVSTFASVLPSSNNPCPIFNPPNNLMSGKCRGGFRPYTAKVSPHHIR